jgi:hypothetical protein
VELLARVQSLEETQAKDFEMEEEGELTDYQDDDQHDL